MTWERSSKPRVITMMNCPWDQIMGAGEGRRHRGSRVLQLVAAEGLPALWAPRTTLVQAAGPDSILPASEGGVPFHSNTGSTLRWGAEGGRGGGYSRRETRNQRETPNSRPREENSTCTHQLPHSSPELHGSQEHTVCQKGKACHLILLTSSFGEKCEL